MSTSTSFQIQSWMIVIWSILLCCSGIVFFALTVRMILRKERQLALLSFVALALSVGFGRSNVESVSLGVFKLQMGELNQAIGRADASVDQMQALGSMLSRMVLHMDHRLYRFADTGIYRDEDNAKKTIIDSLRSIGFTPDFVSEVQHSDMVDIEEEFITAVNVSCRKGGVAPEPWAAAWDEVRKHYDGPPTPDDTDAILNKFQITLPLCRKIASDYRAFVGSGGDRLPPDWSNRYTWMVD